MKPYYQQDGITIYHGDCQEVMAGMSPVDLVVTSPPIYLRQNTPRRFLWVYRSALLVRQRRA